MKQCLCTVILCGKINMNMKYYQRNGAIFTVLLTFTGILQAHIAV